MKIGETIRWADTTWRVLDTQDNRALLITECILQQRAYHDKYAAVTWADSSLRAYLNGAFFAGFSRDDQARVVPVLNHNPDNPWYGTPGGQDTNDRVFLLSLDQVCRLFGDSSDKLYHPKKNQRYWFERKDENNHKRLARLQGKEGCWWWWLRSPGRVGVKAAYIWGTDGGIGIQGNNVLKGNISDGKCTGGVRPALWIATD